MSRPRIYSQAYLTADASTVPESIAIAGQLGYRYVGLRLMPRHTNACWATRP